MEQDNKSTAPVELVASNNESILSRNPVLIPIFIFLVIIGYVYWPEHSNKRAECESNVEYNPATQSVSTGLGKQGESEYYSNYSPFGVGRKFKTRDEAIDYCMSIKSN